MGYALGQEMTAEEQAAVRAKIDEALAVAGDQMSEVERELEMVRDPILREQIADVGPYFTEGKLLSQMVMDATAIAVAVKGLQDSLSGWFGAFETGLADAIHARAQGIYNRISAEETEAIVDEDERLAQFHSARHTDPVDALAAQAVAMANPKVPAEGEVPMPPPAGGVEGVAIGIGILVAGVALAAVLTV